MGAVPCRVEPAGPTCGECYMHYAETCRSWPQGFFPVQFGPSEGTWFGQIDPGHRRHIRIVAVVAPPTSEDFFTYYERVGREVRRGIFEPLSGVPAECVNQDSVQARVP